MKVKKIIYSSIYIILLVVFSIIGSIVSESATKSTSGFFRSDLVSGIATDGTGQLSTKGYSKDVYLNANAALLIYALGNDDVIFINTHGDSGSFTLSPHVNITSNVITSASFSNNARLVYISACKTGANSTSSSNVCNALISRGVNTVVSFKENISWTTAKDGCNRFNSIFVYKWINGYTIYSALSSAKSQIYSESGKYWGTDSYIVFGNGSLTLY